MKIIGHRGAKGLAPENTLKSFQKALEHNVDEIECDIYVTHDNVPVMLHDSFVMDADGKKLLVAKHSYTELVKHKPDMPTLEEAIKFVDRAVPIYLEVKPDVATKPVADCVAAFLKRGWRPSDFLLASFDFKALQALHAELPEVRTIVLESWSGIRAGRRARKIGTTYISLDQKWLWGGYVSTVSRSGYNLYSYTLNNPKKARRWAKRGLYAAVTDYPDLYQQN